MVRLLLDTNIVSYWMWDQPQFRGPLRKAFQALVSQATAWNISAVSVQEILVAAQAQQNRAIWRRWIGERVDVLDFTERCAERAADLQLAVARDPWETKSQRREITNIWCRDAAIAGTAIAEGLDVIITTDKRFRKYQRHFSGEIMVVEPGLGETPN